jgi:hypothetical protein
LSVASIFAIRVLGSIVVGGFFVFLILLFRARETIVAESPALMLAAMGAVSLAVGGVSCRWVGAELLFRAAPVLGSDESRRLKEARPWRVASNVMFALGICVMYGVVLIAVARSI